MKLSTKIQEMAGNLGVCDTNSSCDFAIYDDHVATEVFPQANTYFGKKTDQAVNVERYQRLCELIDHCAHAEIMEGEQILLASDELQQAA